MEKGSWPRSLTVAVSESNIVKSDISEEGSSVRDIDSEAERLEHHCAKLDLLGNPLVALVTADREE